MQCLKCKKMGHYADNCTEKPVEGTNPNMFQKAMANHVNVEEVYDKSDRVVGKFLVNSCITFIHIKNLRG